MGWPRSTRSISVENNLACLGVAERRLVRAHLTQCMVHIAQSHNSRLKGYFFATYPVGIARPVPAFVMIKSNKRCHSDKRVIGSERMTKPNCECLRMASHSVASRGPALLRISSDNVTFPTSWSWDEYRSCATCPDLSPMAVPSATVRAPTASSCAQTIIQRISATAFKQLATFSETRSTTTVSTWANEYRRRRIKNPTTSVVIE